MVHTILVFDDDRLNLRSIGRVLRGTFDEVLLAQTAHRAEELLAKHRVTHILCDRQLTESMTGEQFIIKWRRQWPSIRYAALMTGEDAHGLPNDPLIDAIFMKPFEPAELRSILYASQCGPIDQGDRSAVNGESFSG